MCIITSTVTVAGIAISAAVANTMLSVGAVATIASTVLGTVSSVQQGKSQQAMYNYQAQVANENAKIGGKTGRDHCGSLPEQNQTERRERIYPSMSSTTQCVPMV